jgi:prevent-host-death family protein
MTTTVGAYEAKTHLSRLLEEVEAGGEVIVTKHGRPIARIVPIDEPKRSRKEVLADLDAFSRGKTLGDISIRELIDEGRRL